MERSLRQNKYYKLISNTLLFGIGTFGSKLLVFLLMPLYTSVLSEGEYGTVDLMVQMSNLCLPLVSVGVLNAIIRFGLDKEVDKRDVFTTGLTVIACGFLAFLLLEPLLRQIRYISDYTFLIYLYVLCSLLRSLCSQFVRAQQRVKLYTFDGVLSTAMVLGFNLFLLLGLKLGIVGYMLATILSDLCSALFLFVVAGLWRFLRYRPGMGAVSKAMLRYAVPLIPTTVFWWITNVSDRFIVSYMLGVRLDGLYAVSYKVPTVVVLVSNIFIDAWQMSAVVDALLFQRIRRVPVAGLFVLVRADPMLQADHPAAGVGHGLLSRLGVCTDPGGRHRLFLHGHLPGQRLYGAEEQRDGAGHHCGGRRDQHRFKPCAHPGDGGQRRGAGHLCELFRSLFAARGQREQGGADALEYSEDCPQPIDRGGAERDYDL